MEYTLVSYADTGMSRYEEFFLQLRQTTTNLHDVVVGTLVDFWIFALDKVKDVHGQGAIPCSNLIDDEIFVREVFQEILRYKALCNGLSVVRLRARGNQWHR
jgi:hypothetical protein